MDHPPPDDIQARPPERRSEEFQAHSPALRPDAPPTPNYDFKKPLTWWPEVWLVLLAVLVCLVVGGVWQFGGATNKIFSNVRITGNNADGRPSP